MRCITPDGYTCLDIPRASSIGSTDRLPRGGGVALIFRNEFHYKKLEFDFNPKSFEFLVVSLAQGGVRTIIATIYRLDGSDLRFFDDLRTLLEMLIVYSCGIVIQGDFNIHLDIESDAGTRKLDTILRSFCLRQMVDGPTHRAGHTLDAVLVRADQSELVSTLVHPPVISDHSLVVTKFPVMKPRPVSYSATIRSWKHFDRASFLSDLQSSSICSPDDWSEKSVDELADIYHSTLSTLVDRYAPCIVINKHYRPITPWFNDACRAQKRKARCLERVYRRTRSDEDRKCWIKQLGACQEFYEQVQNIYWQTLISDSSGNARKLWNTLSSVMGKKKTSPVQDGINADVFLKCFSDKIADIRSATSGSGTPSFSPFTGTQKLNSFPVLSVGDVTNLIARAANKSCGLDPAPTWLVKEYADQLAPLLTVLFNKSLSSGYFPNSFRIAEITPILKKSTLDPAIPGNYRPISNLQFISKVLERVVNEQLMLHLRIYDLLPEHQSAYRSCHSTKSALLKVTSDALLAADQGKLTLLGMLDMSAAFDCVDHIILIRRLNASFGIDENALDWIVSYIAGRKQYVRYNGQTSHTSVVECGVPQGSVLGPLYFVLFTADVFGIADEHGFSIHGYADDMQIYDHWLRRRHESPHIQACRMHR